ncbi:MAG: sulfotransferase domain-containing protein [Litorimonas sp.]
MLQFISYPKSGRSWLRYALTYLDVAKDIKFHHDGFEFNRAAKPAHNFSLNDRLERYQGQSRIIYLTRDPRDLMVSLYFQITGRYGPVFSYEGSISDFIRDEYFGAENLQKFREIWDNLCAKNIALKVTYESCHQDFSAVLSQIVQYYEMPISPDEISRAKNNASFENMKRKEQARTFPKNWLKPKNGSPKMRRGVTGGYPDYLTALDIEYLNEIFALKPEIEIEEGLNS